MSKKGFDDIPEKLGLSKQTQKSGKAMDCLQKENRLLSQKKCLKCEEGDHLNELELKINEDQAKIFKKDKAKEVETEMKCEDDDEDNFPCKIISNPSCCCSAGQGNLGHNSSSGFHKVAQCSRNNVTLSLKSSLGKLSIKSCSVYCLTKENDEEQLPCIQLKTDHGIRTCTVKRICCTDPSSEENNSDVDEVYKSMFFCIDLICKPKESSRTSIAKVISGSCQLSVAQQTKALCYSPADGSSSPSTKTEFKTSNIVGSQTQIEALADYLSKNAKYNFYCAAPTYCKGCSFLSSNGFYDILCETSKKVKSGKIPLDVIVFEAQKKSHPKDTMDGKEDNMSLRANSYQYDNPYESSRTTSCNDSQDFSTDEGCTESSGTQIVPTMADRLPPTTCCFCQKTCKSCCFKISESQSICCCCRFSLPTLAKEAFAKKLASQNKAACFFQFSSSVMDTPAPKTTKDPQISTEPARISPLSTGKSNRKSKPENTTPSSSEQPEDHLFIFCTTVRKIIDNNKRKLFRDLNDQLSTCLHTTKSCNRSK